MNILLTSVGRRAYMVKYFKDVVGQDGQIHVCNSDDCTVAFHYADKAIISPLIYDETYIPFLLQYCQENEIGILISLFDIDLLVLAEHRNLFEQIGTRLIVSSSDVIKICNDKWKTYCFLKENGFHVPKTYLTLQSTITALDNGELQYPIVIKPRFGCGSLAVSVAEDEMALLYYYRRNTRAVNKTYLKYESASVEEKILFQEKLVGQEYGIDIINDLNGKFKNAVIKRKIAMRAGETDIAEITENNEIQNVSRELAQLTKHIANMDCDMFLVGGVPYILEMNARFGGGYPFSHMAGCNLPKAIVDWVKGKEVPAELLEAAIGVKGYKELVLTRC